MMIFVLLHTLSKKFSAKRGWLACLGSPFIGWTDKLYPMTTSLLFEVIISSRTVSLFRWVPILARQITDSSDDGFYVMQDGAAVFHVAFHIPSDSLMFYSMSLQSGKHMTVERNLPERNVAHKYTSPSFLLSIIRPLSALSQHFLLHCYSFTPGHSHPSYEHM